jgi:hypothetical protein
LFGWGWFARKEKHFGILAILLGCMSIAGVGNLMHQWSIMGEFSNQPLEEMVEWIKTNTPQSE